MQQSLRDTDLTVTYHDRRVLVRDGCQTWKAEFVLDGGELKTTSAFAAVTSKTTNCDRPAPLPQVLQRLLH